MELEETLLKVFLEQQRNVPPPQHHLSGSKAKVKHKAV